MDFGYAIHLYHGTDLTGYLGIGLGDPKAKGRVTFPDLRVGSGKHGAMLGRGIYATSTLAKALMYGKYIYLVKFRASRIRVVRQFDRNWQADTTLDAVYVRKNILALDEFCFRDCSKVLELHVLQTPKRRLENGLVRDVTRLSETLEAICRKVPNQDFVVYEMFTAGDEFHCKYRTDGGREEIFVTID